MGAFGKVLERFWPRYGGSSYLWPHPMLGDYGLSPATADTLPPVMRALQLIGGDLGRLPVRIQKRDADAWTAVDHPAADLLERPNEYQSGFEWRRTMTRDLMLNGNAASVIRRTNGGELIDLVPLMPGSFQLIYATDQDVHYQHGDLGRIECDDILHFRLAGSTPLWGDSPVVRARATVDLMAEQERAGREHFRTGGIGKVALSLGDTPLGEDAVRRLQQSFADSHAKAGALGSPIVMQGGMTAETLGSTLSQSEWIEARNYSVRQVSMIYGVPPQLLFCDDDGNLENTYTQLRAYVDGCLSHYTALFAQEIARKLLGSEYRVLFDLRHLLRGSLDQVVAAARQAIDAGVMTQNEARELLQLPPIDGGDVLVMSKNYAPGGVTDEQAAAGDQVATEDQESDDDEGASGAD